MLEKSFGLLFFLKQSKIDGKEKYVYLRITVDGMSNEFSTKRTWFTDRWNQHTGRATGTKEDARLMNEYLNSFSAKVHQVRNEMLIADKRVTAAILRDFLLGKDEASGQMLLKVLWDYNQQIEKLVGKDYKIKTFIKYKTTYSHLFKFISLTYNCNDVLVKEIDFQFVEKFTLWLKVERNCNQNSCVKYLTILKKITTLCLRSGWLRKDPFIDMKLTTKPANIICLNKEELERIYKKSFEMERVALVRDIFVFSCYTGLAYVDVHNLLRSQIIPGIDGGLWIFTNREKTDTPSRIPLLPIALKILDRYKDHPKCRNEGVALPVISNQKINAYLKEIADICCISKRLTFHIARHTFATTIALSNGVPLETVSKILGHKNIKQTQHYAKILDNKISEDMNRLRKKLQTESKENFDI